MSSLLVVRTEGNPAVIVPLVRQAFSAVDPTLAIYQVDTGRYLHSATALFFSIVAGIATLLGTFAWVLALAGLYGVLAHVVQLRTREIGLRVALGARREQILGMVVREGLRPAGIGIAGGLALGVMARLALQPQLQRLVPSFDWPTLMLAPVLFLAAAWLACYLPARRAASVDPTTSLRSS
jgi:ABC-type antimicrobial peptide transport system permease subunit